MDYPSHTFVIDCREASLLFGNVRPPNESEFDLECVLREFFLEEANHDCVREPHPEGVIAYLSIEEEDTTDVADKEDFQSEYEETGLPDNPKEERPAESDDQATENCPSTTD